MRRSSCSTSLDAFLLNLAVIERAAAPTRNQALAAILFLYKEVLEQALLWLKNVTRA